MKNLKRKIISLAVSALAFLGAGAFGLYSNATAKAAETEVNYGAGLTMTEGASICLEDGYQGIRWETTVKKHADYKKENNPQFGVIVAPTKYLTMYDLELNHELGNNVVLDLAFEANAIEATAANATYYSVVDYKDLAGSPAFAYALELTARAYVNVGGTYYYADLTNCDTSRSARSIAISAELSGKLDEYRKAGKTDKADIAVSYYRAGDVSKGPYDPGEVVHGLDTSVVDLRSASPSAVVNNFEVEGTVDAVYVGAKNVPYTYESNTLTLTDLAGAPAGEKYATVFTTDGEIYTHPLIVATKVLTQASDLEMFHAKGVHKSTTTPNTLLKNGEYIYDGYYVLGNDIDASGYVHGSKNYDKTFNNAKWPGISSMEGVATGLMGTFNGMGYSIDGLTIGSQYEGIFGVVQGGTVKNVAITNVKSDYTDGGNKYVLAYYLIAGTIENVHIETNAYDANDATSNPGFAMKDSALLAYNAYSYNGVATTITNTVLIYSTVNPDSANTSGGRCGIAFNHYSSTDEPKYQGLYCISNNKFTAQTSASGTTEIVHPVALVPYNTTNNKAGALLHGDDEELTYEGLNPNSFAYLVRYNTMDDMKAAKFYKNNASILAETGCWTVAADGTLSWADRIATPPETPVEPNPDTPSTDALKILLIGNSHSRDTFWAVPEVARAQGVTDYTFAFAKQSGTKMPDQVNNLSESVTDWEYFISEPSNEGAYDNTQKNKTLAWILGAQDWDYIFLQLGPWDPIIEGVYENERNTVVSYITSKCPNAEFGYVVSWLSPYQKDEKVEGSADSLAMYNQSVLLAGGEETAYARYNALLNNVKSSLYNEDGTPNGPHSMVITVGTPVYYFTEELKVDFLKLYNDPVHIDRTDVGAAVVAYAFYMQFMYNLGLVEECTVNLDSYTKTGGGTYDLTQSNNQPKKDIAEAVNFMLQNPWTLPGEAPGDDNTGDGDDNTSSTNVPLTSYKKFLVIGNSHSEDTLAAVPAVLKAEGFASGYTLGYVSVSGSSALTHVENINSNAAKYGLMICTNYTGGKGFVKAASSAGTLADVLQYDGGWDVVFLQNGPYDLAEETKTVASSYRTQVESHIKTHCPNAKIAYLVSWMSPDCDDYTYLEDKIPGRTPDKDVAMLESEYANYDPTSWKIDYKNPKTQHNKHCDLITNNILNNDTYITAIGVGTAIIYANQVLGKGIGSSTNLSKGDSNTYVDALHRDFLHLSDNGRVLAAYAFVAQYMGQQFTEIKLNELPKGARAQVTSSALTITDEWKAIILEAANYAYSNTWTKFTDLTNNT